MLTLRIHGYALAVLSCFIILIAASQTDPSEINALIDIKKSLVDHIDNLRNWNTGDPCMANWTGVWCSDMEEADGYFHVHKLYLINMNLSGSLAPQLGQLSHLKILSFMWNNLTGTIPKEIGNITSLELLLLSGNKLSGSLPDELGNLSNLDRLQVDENQLSGPIPESFANMVKVKHLHMNNNTFRGQLPSKLSKLSILMHLLVDNNNLSGYLPSEFSMLQKLRILQLDNNNFSGNGIPSTYANFSSLAKLDLSWNQFSGHIPSNKLADNMTTIDLSNNQLNGSIPLSFLYPRLQKLSLENNLLFGSIPASIWQNMAFNTKDKLTINLQNNSLSGVLGILNPPANVTLRLSGNPICKNSNIQSIGQYCGPDGYEVEVAPNQNPKNPITVCLVQDCQENFYELYAPSFPVPCFCAAPLRIGYRLKSPSFSYFPPYIISFQSYITKSLNLDPYQLSIYAWEDGYRITMYLELFPSYDSYPNMFNASEVYRIRTIFTSWQFPPNYFFGPYELLNFTLLGPYANPIDSERSTKTSKVVLVAVLIAAAATSNVSIKLDSVKNFTFRELALATNNFSCSAKVGQGGYGNVYKGILSGKTLVAIKRAAEGSLQGQKEFLTEIELLSRVHHRNLVSLIGYCDEEQEQMLVYEFMPNGTLRDWISGKSEKAKERQNFGMGLKIAMGAAKGILYLHTEANPPIFHRDIKAGNILLDSKLTAKVADFGLSRLAPCLGEEDTGTKYVSTIVKGTPGYLDPEYVMTHTFSDKSDVYSLGVVFLELLTGMQPISRGKHIVNEVNVACRSGKIYSIIESRMGSFPFDCLDKFLTLALRCCQDNPEERPSMLDVVRELEDLVAMLPESETSFPDVTLDNSGEFAPSSSSGSNAAREDQHKYAYVSGSNLVSGVAPTIVPR
ncbi:putative LRR receptor-like serine/threonine-protein kinase [Mucuna pruriens]|uniref:non-specific serine/threonine protein kinase n=1 Tax=Mucuna pruriens TaxID=157652 RepID=A0A371H8F4_MUCPR|nr:putative LRR receptor-like serine/threonine-protein kinase [Mucuna pruriens]